MCTRWLLSLQLSQKISHICKALQPPFTAFLTAVANAATCPPPTSSLVALDNEKAAPVCDSPSLPCPPAHNTPLLADSITASEEHPLLRPSPSSASALAVVPFDVLTLDGADGVESLEDLEDNEDGDEWWAALPATPSSAQTGEHPQDLVDIGVLEGSLVGMGSKVCTVA